MKNNNLNYVSDFIDLDYFDIYKISHIGPKSFKEIYTKLHNFGIRLKNTYHLDVGLPPEDKSNIDLQEKFLSVNAFN